MPPMGKHEAPEGTVVPLKGSRVAYAVRGGNGWHRCTTDDQMSCSCMDFLHRHSRGLTPCRHLRALMNYLMTCQLVQLEMEQRAREAVEEAPPLPTDDAALRKVFA